MPFSKEFQPKNSPNVTPERVMTTKSGGITTRTYTEGDEARVQARPGPSSDGTILNVGHSPKLTFKPITGTGFADGKKK
jgi:hypothetical protein